MSKLHEALLYEQLPENKVRCHLCAHKCLIAEGRRGICQVRGNHSGKLYSLTYGKLIAAHVDPIEKKPLFHFYPGSNSFSIASAGCNFRCEWCQNWEISQEYEQESIDGTAETPPEAVIASAKRSRCQSISYTYTEPTVFFEYSYDVSKLAHAAGMKNVYVTNGYMTQEMIDLYAPLLDAANVDIKAFTDEAYRKYIGAHLQPVLDACVALKQAGVWLEITTLLIPGVNDDETQLKGLVHFIAEKLGLETPWHVSRYFPHYKFNAPTTPLASIEKAIEIGQAAGLKYIYGGNFQGAANTICPQCHTVLIERYGMSVSRNRIKEDNTCPVCGYKLAGVGMSGK